MKKKERIAALKARYTQYSPNEVRREGEDGTYYPKILTEPDIRIDSISKLLYDLIPDKKELPRPWYELPARIRRAAEESYICYDEGLYLTSLLCSMTAIEYSVKLAHIVTKGNPKIFTAKDTTLGSFTKLDGIGLGQFNKPMRVLIQLRNGVFHFNHDSMNKAAKIILKGEDDDPLDSWYIDRPAHFSYELMLQIIEKTTEIVVDEYRVKRSKKKSRAKPRYQLLRAAAKSIS